MASTDALRVERTWRIGMCSLLAALSILGVGAAANAQTPGPSTSVEVARPQSVRRVSTASDPTAYARTNDGAAVVETTFDAAGNADERRYDVNHRLLEQDLRRGDREYELIGGRWYVSSVGTATYLDLQGHPHKMTLPPSPASVSPPPVTHLEGTVVGTESLDGVPCQKVRVTQPGREETYWIGISDHYLRKVERTHAVLDSGGAVIHEIERFSDFDKVPTAQPVPDRATPTDDCVMHISNLTPTSGRQPAFPALARAMGVKRASVGVRFALDTDGSVSAAVAYSSGNPAIDKAAMDAARTVHFPPVSQYMCPGIAPTVTLRYLFEDDGPS